MKKNKNASTLIEAMVVVAILTIWLVWVYGFFSKSLSFLDWVSSRIEAIEIAREGIEAVENIRNTNWLLFPWNTANCWNVFGYNADCMISWKIVSKIDTTSWKNYILDKKDWRWQLIEKTVSWTFKDLSYRNAFAIWINWNKQYCQNIWTDCKKIPWNYLRKINIKSNWPNKMIVTSTVEWLDSSMSKNKTVEIKNLLTNYKN